ncbi:TraB/GumN family protein [Fulvivirga sp. RKSG066]|uniref:TraB/GumN family protein n=1 Tax=Fulvivirga aurantia TaxID=2529383 RepID=UPI0012BBB6C2|nr:TraB/GumN family protein [Fulvivirga aurantia]MTI22741.1 TraB/GumN family protein [Fulvivirga aurantia]
MRKIFLSILTLIIFSASQAVSQDLENAVLWEVSGNGLEKPSYIYGIINFLPKDAYEVPKVVKKKMDQCEVFATKIIYDNAAKKQFNKAVRIPNNGWINDYLTDNELNQLRLLLLLDFEVKEHQYHDFYSRLQPIILVTSTTALYLDDNIIYVEEELASLAKKNRMDFVGLGTIDEEIAAFKKFPIEDQVEAAKYTVNQFDRHIEDYNNLVKYYVEEQDLVKVKDETLKATNESQEFKRVYYDDRVIHWLPKIEGLIKVNPTFFAVGAPYLVGEVSMIELLRKQGYKVEPVSLKKN